MADDQQEELSYEEKRRIEQKKEFETIARATMYTIQSMNRRHRAIEDPGTKYALLVDKLCVVLDISGGVLRGFMEEYGVDPEIQAKIEETHENLQQELDGLMKWVVNPNAYSPDHVFGNAVMRGAQNDMESRN